jgi:hypothetical protein
MKCCFQCGREFREPGKFCSDSCAKQYLRATGQSHSIVAYCKQFGIELKRKGRELVGLCPLHQDKTPSFYVYEDNHYHCFGCGAHGDSVDLCAAYEGIRLVEAAERLAGAPTHATPVITAAPVVKAPPYLFSDSDLTRIRAGCERLAGDLNLITRLCKKRPEWTAQALRSACLDGDLSYEDDCRFGEFRGPAMLFAYRYGIKARWRGKKIRWILGNSNAECWRQSLMHSGHTRAFFTEGETDCLTCIGLDLEADEHSIVLGLAGATMMPSPEPFQGMEIVIIPDLDNPGEECSKRLRKLLEPVARKISTVHLEDLHG